MSKELLDHFDDSKKRIPIFDRFLYYNKRNKVAIIALFSIFIFLLIQRYDGASYKWFEILLTWGAVF